ncbi:cobyric acid synthase [Leptospira fletcheri]|uniref:Cobyric acid synthase n=1 Tax=Leptospira fletcheri TaxID=2484981 RepID=A0A4R9GIT7_9LEPT|nr:cobyric acid synthase [Leptospira fletcheri]TGK11993.1 cobyric acid synthase [Leptospira fletcheri]
MEISEHGGNVDAIATELGCVLEEITDFSANINPRGLPDWVRPLIGSQISRLIHYPDPHYGSVKRSMEKNWGVKAENIVLGNGASELLYFLPRILNSTNAILFVPSYADYESVLKKNGIPIEKLFLTEENEFEPDYEALDALLIRRKTEKNLVLLGHPNNPTGKILDEKKIGELIRRHKETIWVLDESFLDFCPTGKTFLKDGSPNVIVLKSLTKILALPGLRIGFCVAAPGICRRLEQELPLWSLNRLSAAILEKATEDEEFFRLSRANVQDWKNSLLKGMESLRQIRVFTGDANFLLLKLSLQKLSVSEVCDRLLKEHKISVRRFDGTKGIASDFIRVAVRTPKENETLTDSLRKILNDTESVGPLPKTKRKAPALMIQGTASNVGKSLMAAAFCRILRQDGIDVAPFKSQNMALNSFVTPGGGEIGRAQALQAQAAGVTPDVRMNPVLLKPSSEKDSQVILNGKPVGGMDFRDYTEFKPKAFEEVKRSYDSLADEFEAVVIEGAGSVSEVNLKNNDIVNMNMACYAEAKVLIVGNIDHGGVFGALVGSLDTMAEWERSLVSGFIINRLRGIPELLLPGVRYLETYTGKRVFGVVPHFDDLSLPEEDSLEFKSGNLSDKSALGNRIDVVLIDTPRISNHTDVDALRWEADVRVRIARSPKDVGSPDVLILGGSKNVASDMQFLNDSGFAKTIFSLVQNGATEIVGICGGYQILGNRINDPHSIESNRGTSEGLGLLPLETTLQKEKALKQVSGIHSPSGKTVYGYEIHHGTTELQEQIPVAFVSDEGSPLGHSERNGRIWGTYLHGVFDGDEFRRHFIDKIRVQKGMQPVGRVTCNYDVESKINRLAKGVRESVDISAIYGLLGFK